MRGINVIIEVRKGTTIQDACDSVKVLSEFIGEDIEFKFNGNVITTKNKSINDMVDSYLKQRT